MNKGLKQQQQQQQCKPKFKNQKRAFFWDRESRVVKNETPAVATRRHNVPLFGTHPHDGGNVFSSDPE